MTERFSTPEPNHAVQLSEPPEVADDDVVIAESIGSIFASEPAGESPVPPQPAIDAISYFVRDEEYSSMNVEAPSQNGASADRTLTIEVDSHSKLASILRWLDDDKLATAIAEKALVAMLYPLVFASAADPKKEPVLGELEVAGASGLAYLVEAIGLIEDAIDLSLTDKLKATVTEYCESVLNGEHRYDSERIGNLYKDAYIKDKRRKARLILDNLEIPDERAGSEDETDGIIKSINEACIFKNSIGY